MKCGLSKRGSDKNWLGLGITNEYLEARVGEEEVIYRRQIVE